MRNRVVLFSAALIVFSVSVFLYEARAGADPVAPDHCGFWTTIAAGITCR